jgi:alpha-L-fucosidase
LIALAVEPLVAPGLRAARAGDETPHPSGSSTNAEARRWFEDARFGMFVHWGVYALLGKDAWAMEIDKLPCTEYDKLPPLFNPVKFDAESWVKLAKAAGMKYITITSKYHDGFCMFESKLTGFDIVDATPFGKDPIRALAGACHKQGIKLFFYYSLLDWHHPDYFPRGRTGHGTGREERGDWKRYVAYYQGQVRELCTNYGEIGGIWFDGWWDRPDADWDLEQTYRVIHELQPGALVGNNHHVAPLPGEDFQIFEQDLPGENSAGFNKAEVATRLPLETCLTINQSWGYNAQDTRYKSSGQLIAALVQAAGRGANLLLNVGPRPDGTIGREFREPLLAMGKWLDAHGESIYGTRRGPIDAQTWGVSTVKASGTMDVYLHVLKPTDSIALPLKLITYTPFAHGKTAPLKWTPRNGFLSLELPEAARMPIDTIVVLRPLGESEKH